MPGSTQTPKSRGFRASQKDRNSDPPAGHTRIPPSPISAASGKDREASRSDRGIDGRHAPRRADRIVAVREAAPPAERP